MLTTVKVNIVTTTTTVTVSFWAHYFSFGENITLKVHLRYLKYWSYHRLLHVSAAEEGEELENQFYFAICVS